ncbi:ATP-dependent Zn protease [Rhizobium leguminosarum]|uniref:ATP-dependent Zn protease n=1 Tax=Rhizobium leguminosarum TaxID=384 RepID=UPI001C93F24F|nr:ATP-dependent Zn protease [Rhizobium leguminosarum]MBY5707004.1 ATP-dependent Zn protease [Rhizobium leguminosarum]
MRDDKNRLVNGHSLAGASDKGLAALRHLALAAQGMTGADIQRLVREARQKARRARRRLRYVDILDILERDAGSLPPEVRWRISVHEAGHALLFIQTGTAEILSITTGRGNGGNTQVRWPTTSPQTETGIMNVMACYLAGRAAELTIFGEALIGNGGGEGSDLAIVTASALQLETILGCSRDTPLLYMPSERPAHDLRFDPGLAGRVNKRLEVALAVATDVVSQHREPLLKLARELDGKSYLEGEEVHRLLGPVLPLSRPAK